MKKNTMKKDLSFQFDLNCRWAVYVPSTKDVNQAINKLQEEAEKAFAASCDDKLVCVGVFSNGEAIYKRA